MTFTAFSDLAVFTERPAPLPEQPTLVFVGSLEPYKNVEGLATPGACGQLAFPMPGW